MSDEQRERTTTWVIFGLLVLTLIWGYWNTLVVVSRSWTNAQYSHGYLVPLFAAVLFWLRREPFRSVTASARWTGVGVLAFGLLVRLLGSYYSFNTITSISLIPCLLGILLLVGGWRMFRWAAPAAGFLVFMLPLPMGIERNVLVPLQKVAATVSTYALQTLGVEAFRTGNVISLAETELNVVDACSGLRMATIFLALATAMAIITVRPWWERLVILLSAIPIALAVNVIRITTTGLCYLWFPSLADGGHDNVVHDVAGLVMMPMALGLLYFESTLLSRLVIRDDTAMVAKPVGVGGRQARFGGV